MRYYLSVITGYTLIHQENIAGMSSPNSVNAFGELENFVFRIWSLQDQLRHVS
jgi:hypothetical protein